MTISSWLNFGGPAPPGRGSAAGRNFWLRLTTASAQCLRLIRALFSSSAHRTTYIYAHSLSRWFSYAAERQRQDQTVSSSSIFIHHSLLSSSYKKRFHDDQFTNFDISRTERQHIAQSYHMLATPVSSSPPLPPPHTHTLGRSSPHTG